MKVSQDGRTATIHLDCGHAISYEGGVSDSNKQMLAHRAVMTRTGLSRCFECQSAIGNVLSMALQRAAKERRAQ